MSHTPGPWTWTSPHPDVPLDFHCCRVNEGPILVGADNTEVLSANSGEYSPLDNEDDAPLIAAAPDLLAALRECVGFLGSVKVSPVEPGLALQIGMAEARARAAIAKAESLSTGG